MIAKYLKGIKFRDSRIFYIERFRVYLISQIFQKTREIKYTHHKMRKWKDRGDSKKRFEMNIFQDESEILF